MAGHASHDVAAAMQGHQAASCADSHGKRSSRGHSALRLQSCGRHHDSLRCEIHAATLTSPFTRPTIFHSSGHDSRACFTSACSETGNLRASQVHALRDLPLSSLPSCVLKPVLQPSCKIRAQPAPHAPGSYNLNRQEQHAEHTEKKAVSGQKQRGDQKPGTELVTATHDVHSHFTAEAYTFAGAGMRGLGCRGGGRARGRPEAASQTGDCR